MFYTILCPYPCVSAWGGMEYIYISAWASALLVLARWAMRRPRIAERVTGTDSRAFFRICTGKQEQKTAFPGSLKAQKLSVMRVKEKSLSWLALLLAVVFSVGFASCDKDDDEDGQGSGSIIGTWGYNLDTGYVHITFNEDGTGSEDEYDADGGMGEGYLYSASFSWRQDGDRIIIKFDDDDYSQVYEDVSVTSTTLTWTDPYGDREMMKRQSRIRN